MTVEHRTTTTLGQQEISEPQPGAHFESSAIPGSSSTFGGLTSVDVARRLVILAFAVVQGILALQIVLLLVDARPSAPPVAAVFEVARPLVSPFVGMLRSPSMAAGRSVLDLVGIAAFVGWTVLEVFVLALLGLFRSDA